MKALFIHQNFPGQFRHLATHLARQPGWQVQAIGLNAAPGLPGVGLWRYRPHRSAGMQTHPYARVFESAVLHGQQVLRMLLRARKAGYRPDVVIAHPGWGESLYVKQAYPRVPLIHYCEYYYHPHGADADFDPEFPLTPHAEAAIESRNAVHLLNLEHCDLGVVPTRWQLGLQPLAYRGKLRVIHEGIDIARLGPDPGARLVLPDGQVPRAGDPVITYVARNLEPYRGFHQLVRALPAVLEQNPGCHVAIVGGDGVSYGRRPADAPDWRTRLVRENPMDTSRVHFLGKVDYDTYRTVLQTSAVHVYLTYPFVLSWSLLEAMATGCAIVASATAPVREVLVDGSSALLVDFMDRATLQQGIRTLLENRPLARELGAGARRAAKPYGAEQGTNRWMGVIQSLSVRAIDDDRMRLASTATGMTRCTNVKASP